MSEQFKNTRLAVQCDVAHPTLVWAPSSNRVTNMDRFRESINGKYNITLSNYDELYKWSVTNYSTFWEELWHFSKIKYSHTYDKVVDVEAGISDVPQWFEGSLLNYAGNLLSHPDDDKVALYAVSEDLRGEVSAGPRHVRSRTFGELRSSVARYAAAMRVCGVQRGDRVVGYINNSIECCEAMLATASLGAVWSTTSPEFGVQGCLERFAQIRPKLVFSVASVVYNGHSHWHLDKLAQVVRQLDTVEKCVIVDSDTSKLDRGTGQLDNGTGQLDSGTGQLDSGTGQLDSGTGQLDAARTDKVLANIPNSCWLSEFLTLAGDDDVGDGSRSLVFEPVPFSHPLFIMFSSGTTGLPKCMVHSVGGTLLQHMKEHMLHCNMTSDGILLYYTTTGWMMWNWMVSCLALGSTAVLYDGSPFKPNDNAVFDLIDQLGISVLGTSSKWLSVIEQRSLTPLNTNSLTSLHTILSTGSPLAPHSFRYVYNNIKRDNLTLASISGGTDILGCFIGGNPTLPVHIGEVQCRCLGMHVESWNENGEPVLGEPGELVCLKPFPSQPVYFWNDTDDREKYMKAYFSKYKGVWCHGDYCSINPQTGGIVMLGRSDGTLNPGGVRFGSADIYNIVEFLPEVEDSVCISHSNPNEPQEERVVLFIKLAQHSSGAAGASGDEDDRWSTLCDKIRSTIRGQLSARHVPAIILPVHDIPYTASGKKVELAVKHIINRSNIKNKGAIVNPDSLNIYDNMVEEINAIPW